MTAMGADCRIGRQDRSWSGRNAEFEAQFAVPEPLMAPGTGIWASSLRSRVLLGSLEGDDELGKSPKGVAAGIANRDRSGRDDRAQQDDITGL